MANMGKQHISSRQGTNLGQRKSIFEPSKFPQPSPNITPSPETTDLSGYRQPQPGEMMANVMDSLSTSKSASPPNYLTGKQLPAPKRQEREVNMASVNQLKAPPRQSNLSEKPIQKQEESIPNQTGLPDNLKAGIENLSGYSLDNVRVHYNSSKPAQLQALAYTQGTEIHVAPGQEKHLPHEAWHVVQQMQGRVKPTMQMKGRVNVNDDSGLEKEVDIMSNKALEFHSNTLNETAIQNKKVSNPTGIIQRVVAINYVGNTASATITHDDLGTGTPANVSSNLIPSHAHALGVAVGAGHPYHHQRGHLIGRQLGGDGNDVRNLVGLSDGTNAPLMADIEGHVRDILTSAGLGSSVWIQVTIDYSNVNYAGPPAAPHVPGMVGMLSYEVFDRQGGTRLYHTAYPNGVVNNHHAAGCC
ncbi:MAG: DNA/RNA non-specific endonuclease [Lyngbya sp.]|nr:DNA/RNA non-specific endonuclease [Lyngbya sp.]